MGRSTFPRSVVPLCAMVPHPDDHPLGRQRLHFFTCDTAAVLKPNGTMKDEDQLTWDATCTVDQLSFLSEVFFQMGNLHLLSVVLVFPCFSFRSTQNNRNVSYLFITTNIEMK